MEPRLSGDWGVPWVLQGSRSQVCTLSGGISPVLGHPAAGGAFGLLLGCCAICSVTLGTSGSVLVLYNVTRGVEDPAATPENERHVRRLHREQHECPGEGLTDELPEPPAGTWRASAASCSRVMGPGSAPVAARVAARSLAPRSLCVRGSGRGSGRAAPWASAGGCVAAAVLSPVWPGLCTPLISCRVWGDTLTPTRSDSSETTARLQVLLQAEPCLDARPGGAGWAVDPDAPPAAE